jgi:anhydro-N-acetylmuramic acid kinase
MNNKTYTAIGLMSGTSLDGIDAALIRTDGHAFVERLDFKSYTYDEALRREVKKVFGWSSDKDGSAAKAAQLITQAHIDAVKDFGHKADLVGFHGQTIFHDPSNKFTWQIGDGNALAKAIGMDVICDFRTADVQSGGQGAPFLPLYHQVLARSSKLEFPCVILNIGGVSNVTWIGEKQDDVIACDTGPGNALLDDWILSQSGKPYDEDGKISVSGIVNEIILQELLKHPYFDLKPPKSLDRDQWSSRVVESLSLEEGAATLMAFTVDSIIKNFTMLPSKPRAVYVTGGGRKNKAMMQRLGKALGIPVHSVDTLGWDGDVMEAEGFAYLAVRSFLGLPLSLPTTTGVPQPVTGGKLAKAA